MELIWREAGSGSICAEILATVPHWFGVEEANETYRQVADRSPTVVAAEEDRAIGFATVVRHSPHSAEIHVMAVRPERHRQGTGGRLVEEVERRLRADGVEYLQVKTLSAAAADEEYLRTLAFYQGRGFRILEEMPELWDPENPAVLLVKGL